MFCNCAYEIDPSTKNIVPAMKRLLKRVLSDASSNLSITLMSFKVKALKHKPERNV